PLTPYGASKLAGEAFGQAYAATYGLAACSLRFSNAYGPYSLHKKSVVAAWLRAALRGDAITIHGDGQQTRDFVYAEDLAAAVVAALDAGEDAIAGEVFQAGTAVETTVNQLAEALGAAVGRPLEIRHEAARPGDIRRNVSRIDKAARVLGYRPAVSLGEGLRRTARGLEPGSRTPWSGAPWSAGSRSSCRGCCTASRPTSGRADRWQWWCRTCRPPSSPTPRWPSRARCSSRSA